MARSQRLTRFALALGSGLGLCGCAITPDPVTNAPTPGAPAVVFDIDGTLTPDVLDVFDVRPDAPTVAGDFANRGVHIVYLSARIPAFQFLIPGWLERHEFPPGAVQVTDDAEDREDVVAFKRGIVDAWQAAGWQVVAAFGDSTTDFEAYREAGIGPDRIFALRRDGEGQCQPGPWERCFDDWDDIERFLAEVAWMAGWRDAVRAGDDGPR